MTDDVNKLLAHIDHMINFEGEHLVADARAWIVDHPDEQQPCRYATFSILADTPCGWIDESQAHHMAARSEPWLRAALDILSNGRLGATVINAPILEHHQLFGWQWHFVGWWSPT